MNEFLLILAVILLLAGLAGSFLPVLPGPPLAYAGVLLARFGGGLEYGDRFLFTWGVLMLIITVLDYVLPGITVKWGRGSKRAVQGANIGVFIGLFLGPAGILLGPFFGAFIGELSMGKNANQAFRPAFFAFLGFLGGVFIKLCFALYLIGDFLFRIF